MPHPTLLEAMHLTKDQGTLIEQSFILIKHHRKTTTAFRDEQPSERLRILRAFELIPTCSTPKSMTSSG